MALLTLLTFYTIPRERSNGAYGMNVPQPAVGCIDISQLGRGMQQQTILKFTTDTIMSVEGGT